MTVPIMDLGEESLAALLRATVVAGLLPGVKMSPDGSVGDDEIRRLNKAATRVISECVWRPIRRDT